MPYRSAPVRAWDRVERPGGPAILAHRKAGSPAKTLAELLVPTLLLMGAAWPGAPPVELAVAVLAALLVAVTTAGWRLSGLLLPDCGAATRCTVATVLATGLAALPATLLGHLGLLFPGPFLLWAAALAVGSFLLPAVPRRSGSPAASDPRRRWLRSLERGVGVTAVLLLAGSTLFQILALRYEPAGAFQYDDVAYHLSTVATWAERGDLAMVKFAVGDEATPFYPILGELVAWILLAPFRDNDIAARWAQLPYALASLAAMTSLAGRLGVRPRSVVPALALYWSLERVFPRTALSAGNDHMTAFFFLAAVDGVLELTRRRTVGSGLYAGAALGLLLATKYLGVLLAPMVIGLYALVRFAERRRPVSPGGLLPELAAVVATAATGGYAYLRNAVTAGNPLYPAPVRLAGYELFEGLGVATLAWRRTLPEWSIELPEFLWRQDLWGPVAPWFFLSAAVLGPVVALLAPPLAAPRLGRWSAAALLSLPAASFVVFLYLTHDHRDLRYLLAGVAAAAVGSAYLADRLERSGRRGAASLAVAWRLSSYVGVAVAALRGGHGGALPAPAVLGSIACGVAAMAGWRTGRRKLRAVVKRRGSVVAIRGLGAILLLGTLWIASQVAERYPDRKFPPPSPPGRLERIVGPGGAVVAYVGWNTPYSLWGSRLQNRLRIVPTSADVQDRLYDWGGSAGRPFRDPEGAEQWIRNLESLGVSYIFVVGRGEEEPERSWMVSRPGRFRPLLRMEDEEVWSFTAGDPP